MRPLLPQESSGMSYGKRIACNLRRAPDGATGRDTHDYHTKLAVDRQNWRIERGIQYKTPDTCSECGGGPVVRTWQGEGWCSPCYRKKEKG